MSKNTQIPSVAWLSIAGMLVVTAVLLLLPLGNPLLETWSLNIGTSTLKNIMSVVLSLLAAAFLVCIAQLQDYLRPSLAFWSITGNTLTLSQFCSLRDVHRLSSLPSIPKKYISNPVMIVSLVGIIVGFVATPIFPIVISLSDLNICTTGSYNMPLSTTADLNETSHEYVGMSAIGKTILTADGSRSADAFTITDNCPSDPIVYQGELIGYLKTPPLRPTSQLLTMNNVTFIRGTMTCSESKNITTLKAQEGFTIGAWTFNLPIGLSGGGFAGYGFESTTIKEKEVESIYLPFSYFQEQLDTSVKCTLSASLATSDLSYSTPSKSWTALNPTNLYSNYSIFIDDISKSLDTYVDDLFKASLLSIATRPIQDNRTATISFEGLRSVCFTTLVWGDKFCKKRTSISVNTTSLVTNLRTRFNYGLCSTSMRPQIRKPLSGNECGNVLVIRVNPIWTSVIAFILLLLISAFCFILWSNKYREWRNSDDIYLILASANENFAKKLQKDGPTQGQFEKDMIENEKIQLVDGVFDISPSTV
ncbi:hypothetical protein HDV02_001688 [Globomyces sp. JEL0801]|nr:hypothetical protein HDV02_001688 [Globomyces sp. JEL0801]